MSPQWVGPRPPLILATSQSTVRRAPPRVDSDEDYDGRRGLNCPLSFPAIIVSNRQPSPIDLLDLMCRREGWRSRGVGPMH